MCVCVGGGGGVSVSKLQTLQAYCMGSLQNRFDHSQNQDLSISFERPYKELLNKIISFEIRYFVLKLWGVKERASK